MPRFHTPQPRFYLQPKGKAHYIYLTFRYNNERLRLSLTIGMAADFPYPVCIPKSYWNPKKQRVREGQDYPGHTEYNQLIEKFDAECKALWRESKGMLSMSEFKTQLENRVTAGGRPGTQPAKDSLTAYMAEYIKRIEPTTPYNTLKRHTTVLNHLKEYERERGYPITFDEVREPFYLAFLAWLYQEPRNHQISTAMRNIKNIKQVMRKAANDGLHTNVVYTNFRTHTPKKQKLYLTFDELEKLNALNLSGMEEKARDLFLLSAYTGLRVSDYTRLRPEHITENSTGEKQISITTQKMKNQVVIPLLPIAYKILEKYAWKAPKIPDSKINLHIKELCKRAGITDRLQWSDTKGGQRNETTVEKWEKVSTHTGRRSFATNFYLLEVPRVAIMAITGHTSEKQFFDYICVSLEESAEIFRNAVNQKQV